MYSSARRLTVLVFIALACSERMRPDDGKSPSLPANVVNMSLEQLMDVTIVSATLHRQRIGDAPASVSVVTAEDIRKYGYRTIAEALGSVRGLYISTDRSYTFLGARGVSTPGDYGSRYIVMINGHVMADPIYEMSGVLDQRLGLDMDLIRQIEVVHGPASALYGSNAVLCTINIVTKLASEMPGINASVDAGSFGEKKVQASFGSSWKGASLLVSGSVFDFGGERSIYVPEYDSAQTNFGRALSVDGQHGYHFFANATWRNWNFTALVGDRAKTMPVSYGQTIFNDPGTRVIDNRSYLEAMYKRRWRHGELEWRTFYDWYHYQGIYHYPLDDDAVEDNREHNLAEWAGSSLTDRTDFGRLGVTTFGLEARIDVLTLQSNFDVAPERYDYTHINKPDQRLGVFAQHELEFSTHWRAVLGARFDTSAYRRQSVSPRAALIWEPSKATSVKLLYGGSFRNPDSYEMFYADGLTSASNETLRPERGRTVELSGERTISPHLKAVASLFRADLNGLIVAGRTPEGLVQFQNTGIAKSTGAEFELNTSFSRLETGASIAVTNAVDTGSGTSLANSPRQVGKLRLAVPALNGRLVMAGGLKWMSARETLNSRTLASVADPDLTLTIKRLFGASSLQFGVRNLLNRRYYDPVALNDHVDAIANPGRTVFARIIWTSEK